jgi:hypothetical protein
MHDAKIAQLQTLATAQMRFAGVGAPNANLFDPSQIGC